MPALALVAVLAAPAAGAPRRCAGTVKGGPIDGRFGCIVQVATSEEGNTLLSILATDPVDRLQSLVPGGFEIPGPPRAGTFRLSDCLGARIAATTDRGMQLSATRTAGERGEATLVLTEVRKGKTGVWTAHGTLRARLLASGSVQAGELTLEVTF